MGMRCALFCRATVATEHLLRGLLRRMRTNKPFAWKTAVIVEIPLQYVFFYDYF